LDETGTDELAALGYGYAAPRQDSDAKKVLDELKDRAQQTYVQPLGMASIHLALGQKDQAMDWLQAAFNNRSTGLVYLKVDPVFDPLRADARFVDLLRRMGM
jgi:Tfp pilus assembly protein PilF